MLYYSEEVRKKINQITRQTSRGKLSPEQAVQELLAVAPDMPPAIIASAMEMQKAGRLSEAEEFLWRGLQRAPCSAAMYLALAGVIQQLRPKDNAPGVLLVYGFRRFGLAERINPALTETFTDAVEEYGPAEEPETFAMAADSYWEALGAKRKKTNDLRMAPLELFDRLQQEAEDGVDVATLREVLEQPAEFDPLLYAAVRQWANESAYPPLRARALDTFLAILGEIGGPERIADLLELAQSESDATFRHVHWALWRLGQRFPAEALKALRGRTLGADLGMRRALAEQLNLLPEIDGVREALADLLRGFGKFSGDEDAPFLLALTTEAIAARGAVEEAQSLLSLHRVSLNSGGRKWLDETIDGDEDLVPELVEEEIPNLDIDAVCSGGALRGEEEDEEDEFDDEFEDEFDDEFDDEAEDEEEVEEKRAPAPLRALQGMRQWFTAADRTRSALMFHGTTVQPKLGPVEQNDLVLFLLADYRDEATGKTLIEHFLEDHGGELDGKEREELESLRDSRYSLYEIDGIERGRGVAMRNVFGGEEFFLEDRTTSRNASKGDLALLRVQLQGGRRILAGDGRTVRPEALGELREFVRRESAKAGMGEAEFVRANTHRLRREVLDWHDRGVEGVKVVDHVGDEIELCTARYRVENRSMLLTKLRGIEDVVEGPAEDGGLQFTWLAPGGRTQQVYGSISVAKKELRLETTSRARLEAGRALLEHHAGENLRFAGVTMDEIKRRALSGQEGEPRSRDEQQVLIDFREEHYARWPDEKLPAFRGKSARQMMKTPAGRKEVAALLRSMEEDEGRTAGADAPAYDFNKLRRALGLEEE